MLKGKNTMIITTGFICFVLVMIIFMQFKVVYETDITSIDTMKEDELTSELATWKSKYEEVETRYTEVSNTLKKYIEETSSDTEAKKNLTEEKEKLELILGKTDVEGEGIVIQLEEGEGVLDVDRLDYSVLMKIVNYLRDGGAEAISINDQRIINQTDIVNVNTSIIKINSHRVVAPFTIKAIGDPDYLKSSLIGTGGYKEECEALGYIFKIEDSKKVQINKYNNDIEINYIEK